MLVTAALAAAAVGCAAHDNTPEPRTSATPPALSPASNGGASASSIATPPIPSTIRPTDDASVPLTQPPHPRENIVTPPTDGDRRGDLVRGVRTLRGVVEREGDWVLLRTDRDRWALLASDTRDFRNGVQIEVRGTPSAPPAGCPANMALNVIQPRR